MNEPLKALERSVESGFRQIISDSWVVGGHERGVCVCDGMWRSLGQEVQVENIAPLIQR